MSGMNGVLENHKFFQFTTQKDDLTLLDFNYFALTDQVSSKLHCEKNGLQDFPPGTTQTGLYSHRI